MGSGEDDEGEIALLQISVDVEEVHLENQRELKVSKPLFAALESERRRRCRPVLYSPSARNSFQKVSSKLISKLSKKEKRNSILESFSSLRRANL